MSPSSQKHYPIENAIALHRAGRHVAALREFDELLANDSNDADAWHLSGLVAAELGRPGDAIRRFEEALNLYPESIPFLFDLAAVLRLSGEFLRAVEISERAVRADAENPNGWIGLARAYRDNGDTLAAIAAYREANRLLPRQYAVAAELAETHASRPNWEEAAEWARRACELAPDNRDAWYALASILFDAGRTDEAEHQLATLLSRFPGDADAIAATGRVLVRRMMTTEAIRRYESALIIQPRCRLALDGLLAIYARFGWVEAAQAVIARKLKYWPEDESGRCLQLFLLNYQDAVSVSEVAERHKAWAIGMSDRIVSAPFERRPESPDSSRRIRLGYVSADFVDHSVTHFLEPILARHDRELFEVYCYSNTATPDGVTDRIKSLADHWRDVRPHNDDTLTKIIRADGVDILVDLGGHTADNRIGVFARRAAPVQVNFLGYPNTTGLAAMDWIVGDAMVTPAAQASLYSEGLAQLPGSVFCWSPRPDYPLPPARPADAPVVFGSFNNAAKLSKTTVALWAAVLAKTPSSILLLKSSSFRDDGERQRIRHRFSTLGIPPDRIRVRGPSGLAEMMQEYGDIDIALDPTPYNGGTCTLQALWMGVPVLTLRGGNFVGRMGASFLSSLAKPSWIADDQEDYVDKAVDLARRIHNIRGNRKVLRQEMENSPLCAIQTYVDHFESLLRRAWELSCAGEKSRLIPAEEIALQSARRKIKPSQVAKPPP